MIKHYDQRWRLTRAGVVNIWHYLETEFTISGGRLILRGANGSGKSRALEMLLPYLLDADRRRMDATGSNKVNLDELMRTGSRGQSNRLGYLWLELENADGHLTVGAHVKYSATAHRSEVLFFTTNKRVGTSLRLIADNREPLSRDGLLEAVGPDNVSKTPDEHREGVRTKVFGLHGESGKDRFAGLMQLLHTLRSPDVGNRIDEGKLPQILSDALPPLSEQTLGSAGEQLDGLTETRQSQARLEASLGYVDGFASAYGDYAATVLRESAHRVRTAVDDLSEARALEASLTATAARLQTELGGADALRQDLTDERAELARAIEAFREHDLFKTADDLRQRDLAVAALRHTAEQTLEAARRTRIAETNAAARLAGRYDDVRTAARRAADKLVVAVSDLAAAEIDRDQLPTEIHYADHTAEPEQGTVTDSLDGFPASINRPTYTSVVTRPDTLAPTADAADRARDAADHRYVQATHRLQEARRLDTERIRIRELELQAEHARAEADRDEAEAAATATARDEEAIALNRAWRAWLSADTLARILPDASFASDSAVQSLLSDVEALTGDDAAPAADIAGAPRAPIQVRRDEISVALAELAIADTRDDTVRVELLARQRNASRPDLRTGEGTPLWLAVEFDDSVVDTDRAGIEAALSGSGLLTATIGFLGDRIAQGHAVLHASGPATTSLSNVLRADPRADAPLADVTRILESVALVDTVGTEMHTTTVGRDGSWRNGAVRGRGLAADSRLIGSGITDIVAGELAELAKAREARAHRRAELVSARDELDALVSSVPSALALTTLRIEATGARRRSTGSADRARGAEETARVDREQWSADADIHRTTCQGMGLPVSAADLTDVVDACRRVLVSAPALADACHTAESVAATARAARAELDVAVGDRKQGESAAEDRRRDWHTHAAKLASQHDALDIPLSELDSELRRTLEQHEVTEANLADAVRSVSDLQSRTATARTEVAVASEKAGRFGEVLLARVTEFNARVRLDGVADAVDRGRFAVVAHPEDIDHVRSVADSAIDTVADRGEVDVNQLIAALQKFQRDSSGQLDVSERVESDVYVVHIDGAGDSHHVADARTSLRRRVTEGRQALSQRERDVFTGFVLGGVADELRRRIGQARDLITAMNDSLSSTRTSHGIGVRMAWHLDRDEPDLRRILDLVSIADSERTTGDNDELITLLRNRVEELNEADSSAGYAAHLATALDYRGWHGVEVTILGPEPDQQRRISKRAKISQGETRFVSYAALFAAADGYLSSLPDADHALRLVLLDDAFAKIDEATIGELMGLLVRLDIDFVMTGHALWGTVPEVPALDIYEIRRLGDSAVITTRVHWDGKHKHLHALG